MSELSEFRPRIRNWARVYRTRFVRSESNIMLVLRLLKRNRDADREEDEEGRADAFEPRNAPDELDAAFIDSLVLKMLPREKEVLKMEYLTRRSVEDFESTADQWRATCARAHACQIYAKVYQERLANAETRLMILAKNAELKQKLVDKQESYVDNVV